MFSKCRKRQINKNLSEIFIQYCRQDQQCFFFFFFDWEKVALRKIHSGEKAGVLDCRCLGKRLGSEWAPLLPGLTACLPGQVPASPPVSVFACKCFPSLVPAFRESYEIKRLVLVIGI